MNRKSIKLAQENEASIALQMLCSIMLFLTDFRSIFSFVQRFPSMRERSNSLSESLFLKKHHGFFSSLVSKKEEPKHLVKRREKHFWYPRGGREIERGTAEAHGSKTQAH